MNAWIFWIYVGGIKNAEPSSTLDSAFLY